MAWSFFTSLSQRRVSGGDPPAGLIMDYAGGTVPSGWLLCDGSAVSPATYPELFQAIGYNYGSSGPNFLLPDARGRSTVGSDPTGTRITSSNTLGATAGVDRVTLVEANIPQHTHTSPASNNSNLSFNNRTLTDSGGHTHTLSDGNNIFSGRFSASGSKFDILQPAGTAQQWSLTITSLNDSGHTHTVGAPSAVATNHGHTLTLNSTGGSAHLNIQPYLIVTKMIKV